MTPITLSVIIFTFVALIIYDLLVVFKAVKNEKTLSVVMKYIGMELPFFPFMWGVLTGHFFWPATTDPVSMFLHQNIALWLSVFSALLCFWTLWVTYFKNKTHRVYEFVTKYPIVMVVFGVLVGHFVWGL